MRNHSISFDSACKSSIKFPTLSHNLKSDCSLIDTQIGSYLTQSFNICESVLSSSLGLHIDAILVVHEGSSTEPLLLLLRVGNLLIEPSEPMKSTILIKGMICAPFVLVESTRFTGSNC